MALKSMLQYGWGYGMTDFFYQLEQIGFFDVMLPFILIFAILYGVLQKANVFGTDSRKYNVIISLAISMLVIVPHVTGTYPSGFDVVEIMNAALPQIALILIAIVLFLVMVGIVYPSPTGGYKWITSSAVPIAAGLIIIFIFGSAAYPRYMPSWLAWLGDPSLQMLIVILLIFGLIVYLVTGGKDDSIKAAAKTIKEAEELKKKYFS